MIRTTAVSLFVMAWFAACASPPSPPPASPSTSAPTSAPAENTAGEKPEAPKLDIAGRCEAQCARNGATCPALDVKGCVARCTEELSSAPACGGLVDDFLGCVEKSELACEEGDKLRPTSCKAPGYLVAGCLFKQQQMAKETVTQCDELCKQEGRCTMKDGVCVATSDDDCKKSEFCTDAGWCTLVANYCANLPE